MKKNDNRGSTIVMVVLVLVGVGIMASIALWLSLRNVQMKATDAEIKDSFYSAEGVLEQVKAGVQEKAELAYRDALTKDFENFSKYKNNPSTTTVSGSTSAGTIGAPGVNKSVRAEEFKKNFAKTFKESIQDGATGNYQVNKINNLVDTSLINSTSYPYALVTAMSTGFNGDSGTIREDADKLILEGVRVRYVSSEEQVSEIITDITVDVPKPDVVVSAVIPDVFEYAIIGDSGVEVTEGVLDVKGNVYAGKKASTDKTAFLVKDNVKVELSDKTFIANGKVRVESGATFKTGGRERLWAENIVLNSSTAEFSGVSQVSDDLTLNGDGSKAKISGIYRGYGNDKDAASSSSAVIVNGKNSEIDMRAAREVMLSGYSYIGTGNAKLRAKTVSSGSVEANKNTDIKMGESVAIKGNQIAYLIPGEIIGTVGTGAAVESKFNRNPISYDDYKELLRKNGGKDIYTLVNINAKSKKTGKSLSDYGVNAGNLNSSYSKIFVQPITGISSEGLVYFYVNLPQDKAAEYFNDYYNADKDKAEELNRHTKFYTTSMQSALEANVKTSGNYSIVNPKLEVKPGKTGTDSKTAEYLNEFNALCTHLSTEPVSDSTLVRDEIFNNIMNVTELDTYLTGHTVREVTVRGVKAVITSGGYTYDSTSGDVRLIVAKGNVEIKKKFTGTVIAAGKIIIKSAAEISTDRSGILKQLLREPFTSGGKDYLYKIFKNGDAIAAANNIDNVNLLFDDGSIDVSKLISYRNWKKK